MRQRKRLKTRLQGTTTIQLLRDSLCVPSEATCSSAAQGGVALGQKREREAQERIQQDKGLAVVCSLEP